MSSIKLGNVNAHFTIGGIRSIKTPEFSLQPSNYMGIQALQNSFHAFREYFNIVDLSKIAEIATPFKKW